VKPIIDWPSLRRHHLMLASPLYGNQLLFGYHKSVLELTISCLKSGIGLGHKYVGCDSLVPRARNRLVAHFLDSPSTDLLFVDSDITFTAEDALSLLACSEPIVGGVYPRKQLDWHRIAAAARSGVDPEQLPYYGFIPVMNWSAPGDYPLDSPIEVRQLGTGFLRKAAAPIDSCRIGAGGQESFNRPPGPCDRGGGQHGNSFGRQGI